MIRWNNDYSRAGHPAVLAALAAAGEETFGGYGIDTCCEHAADLIRAHLDNVPADIHFLVGGTQANFTVIAAALLPFQSVICADTGHIHVHETGAVEHTGHKVLALPSRDGKITADQIRTEAEKFRSSEIQEHITMPRMVYLSHPTEFGTLYSRADLEAIRAVCDEYDLLLFVDGARLGYALGSKENDITLEDLAHLTDAFYIGGTKCGALFGEAVVLINDVLKPRFRSHIKQNGGMLAKGFLLGIQFSALFENDLYFKITGHAVDQALQIRSVFEDAGVPLYLKSPTNQQFVILTAKQEAFLKERHIFELQEKLLDGRLCVRFCTSWYTKDEDVAQLISDIKALPKEEH